MPISFVRKFCVFFAVICLFVAPGHAGAAVEMSFYSRELGGSNFPHAFVTLKGRPDSGGEYIDTSYGFTATTVSPAILWGFVGGKVINEPASYVAKSDRQFTITLSDEQYNSVMTAVERWRSKPQPSYNLNRANCVHFVGELAQAAGLAVTFPKNLMKKPRSFLLSVREENEALIGDQLLADMRHAEPN